MEVAAARKMENRARTACQHRRCKRCRFKKRERYRFDAWVRKIPWQRSWLPTSVFLRGESHEQGSLASYSL